MMQSGIRFCDACEEEIEKGETYVYYLKVSHLVQES